MVLAAAGRNEEAERAFRQALALCEKNVSDYPDVLASWADLANSGSGLALLLDRTSRPKEAIEAAQKMQECYAQLCIRTSNEPVYVAAQAVNLADLGRRLAENNRREEAKEAYRKAAELYEKFGSQFRDGLSISRAAQAEFFHKMSPILLSLGRTTEAVKAARWAVELYEKLPGPGSPDGTDPPWWRLAVSHHHLGRALIAAGHHGDAIAAYRKALGLRPERAMFNNDLAWMLVTAPDRKLHDPTKPSAWLKKRSS